MIGSGLKHPLNFRLSLSRAGFSRSHDRERIETFYTVIVIVGLEVSPDHMIGSGLKPTWRTNSVRRRCFSRSHDRERIETLLFRSLVSRVYVSPDRMIGSGLKLPRREGWIECSRFLPIT